MKKNLPILTVVMLLALKSTATTFYVNVNNSVPVSPFTSWATAATNIQNAIDASTAGDLVLVTNGVYASGGQVVYGSVTNRVVINKAITVQSVNGPAATVIQGYPVPGATNGDSAVRCVYMTNNAVLAGFTLTNGATQSTGQESGGGVSCESTNEILSNCVVVANFAQASGGGVYSGTLLNCLVTNNQVIGNSGNVGGDGGGTYGSTLINCAVEGNSSSGDGGGVFGGWLTNCIVANNSAPNQFMGAVTGTGGGAYNASMQNCVISNNFAWESGGGAVGGVLVNCLITGNVVGNYDGSGGGVGEGLSHQSMVTNCIISNNRAAYGGGAGSFGIPSTLVNCLIISNTATNMYPIYPIGYGGGDDGDTLKNCTVVGNTAATEGGGVDGSAHHSISENCIIYNNYAPSNSNTGVSSSYNDCCTLPMPAGGSANITNDPAFLNPAAGDFHLQSNSPCINSGNNSYVASATDLDGNPRIIGGTVDMGCYEYQTPGSVLSYAWAQQYGLPTDGSADQADTDCTGMNNYQKCIAGLNPTNPASVLAMMPPVATSGPAGIVVSWQSVNTRTYYLQRSLDLTQSFTLLQSNLVGQAGITTYTDTSATNGGRYFYRIGVQ